ncbi:MAG TPA: hypothetical protein VM802_08945 [Chitinophaga sp.]|nr:hypothetical protein [Chitinophaga sp.]HVI44985.1 hypothetical protein [Chitinophaga sp.]
MKKKVASKLKLAKIKVSNLNQTATSGDNNRTLPITKYATCSATEWVC